MEVELEDTEILWPGGVLYGGGETYENGSSPAWAVASCSSGPQAGGTP